MDAKVCVAVLAGGRSRRMQGIDKRGLLHPESQMTLVQHVCQVAAVTGHPVHCLSDTVLFEQVNCVTKLDTRPYSGPYQALVAFCAHYANQFSHCIALAADMPDLAVTHINLLSSAIIANPDIAGQVLVVDGRRQYLTAVYRVDVLMHYGHLRSFKEFYAQSGLQFRDVESSPSVYLSNINTPQDWELWTSSRTK